MQSPEAARPLVGAARHLLLGGGRPVHWHAQRRVLVLLLILVVLVVVGLAQRERARLVLVVLRLHHRQRGRALVAGDADRRGAAVRERQVGITRCAGPPTAFRPAPPAAAHAPACSSAPAPSRRARRRGMRGAPARRRLVPGRRLRQPQAPAPGRPGRPAGTERVAPQQQAYGQKCLVALQRNMRQCCSRRRAPDLRDVQGGVRRLLGLQVVLHSHFLALLDLHPEKLHVWVHHRHRC